MARALVAQAVYNLPTTRARIETLPADSGLRRVCGWEGRSEVPDESVFSRAFAEFAATELPQRVPAAWIAKTQKERLIGHVSRDATAIAAREGGKRRERKGASAAPAAAKPKRKRGEPKPVEQRTRIERQRDMTREEMLADWPRHCDVGCQTNRPGRKETWRGYQLHLDVAEGQIPIRGVLTSASLHDSQAAIPLATRTARRVTRLYDRRDSAYDRHRIRQHRQSLGHVPIIERLERCSGKVPLAPHEALRFRERTTAERVYARLQDEFGGRAVRVRGHGKVMAHRMFGILALPVDPILRLAG
jgi:hypothetical protein